MGGFVGVSDFGTKLSTAKPDIMDFTMTPAVASQDLVIQCTIICKLADALQHTINELTGTRKSRPSLTVVALLARNLLELRVWIEFCTKSTKNARKLQLDAVRDFDGMIKHVSPGAPDTHHEAIGLFKQFSDARAELEQVLEPGELVGSYQKVRKAAEEIGLVEFDLGLKVLSKFVHPTAFLISVGQVSDEKYTLIQVALIKYGLEIASAAATIGKAFNESIRERLQPRI